MRSHPLIESVMSDPGAACPVRRGPSVAGLRGARAERPFDELVGEQHTLTVSFCRSAIPDLITEPGHEQGLTFMGGTPWAMFAVTPRDLVRAPSANALIERRWGIPASTTLLARAHRLGRAGPAPAEGGVTRGHVPRPLEGVQPTSPSSGRAGRCKSVAVCRARPPGGLPVRGRAGARSAPDSVDRPGGRSTGADKPGLRVDSADLRSSIRSLAGHHALESLNVGPQRDARRWPAITPGVDEGSTAPDLAEERVERSAPAAYIGQPGTSVGDRKESRGSMDRPVMQRRMPSSSILTGDSADVYFARAEEILREGRPRPASWSWRSSRARQASCAASMRPRCSWPTSLVTRRLATRCWSRRSVDGDTFSTKEVVLRIRARYRQFGLYETAILGMLSQSTGWATAARECVEAAAPEPVISFGARHVHPDITDTLDYAAIIGGCVGASTPAGARLAGLAPTGTMPHSLVLIFGDTVRAAEAFDRHLSSDVPRIVLVDTFKDEAEEALRVARRPRRPTVRRPPRYAIGAWTRDGRPGPGGPGAARPGRVRARPHHHQWRPGPGAHRVLQGGAEQRSTPTPSVRTSAAPDPSTSRATSSRSMAGRSPSGAASRASRPVLDCSRSTCGHGGRPAPVDTGERSLALASYPSMLSSPRATNRSSHRRAMMLFASLSPPLMAISTASRHGTRTSDSRSSTSGPAYPSMGDRSVAR